MKKLLILLLACLLIAGCAAGIETPAAEETSAPVTEGYAGPVFTAETVSGETLDDGYIRGNKLTMLNFWATWCPPCVAEMPELSRLHTDYADKGFGIIGMMVEEDAEGAKALIAESGIAYPLMLYPEAYSEMVAGMQYVPTTIFLDASGNQVGEAQVGSKSYEDWKTLVDELLAGLS